MFVASTHKKSHVMKANKSRIGLQFICFNTEPVYLECYICFLFSHRSFMAVIRSLSLRLIIIAHLATTKGAILTIGADSR